MKKLKNNKLQILIHNLLIVIIIRFNKMLFKIQLNKYKKNKILNLF